MAGGHSKNPKSQSQKLLKVFSKRSFINCMNQSPRCLYEFDSFCLDASERVLMREGQVVPLTPKVFETLLVLVENRGHIMSKDELMERLWPDSFVEEANLIQNISVIRRALGENIGTPRFIETIPKRGYRFIAEIRELRTDSALMVEERTVTKLTIDPGEKSSEQTASLVLVGWKRLVPKGMARWMVERPRITVLSSTMAIAAISVGMIFWLVMRPASPSEWLGQLRATQLFGMKSLQGGMLSDSRFSPDGKMIAYSVAEKDSAHIWIMQTNGSRPNQVTQDASRDTSPVWHPNGTHIAYISNRAQKLGIWAVKFLGGTPELLKVLDESPMATQGGSYSLIAWRNNDVGDTTIYYLGNGNLFRFDLATKTAEQITKFSFDKFGAFDLSLSPDRNQAAFIARQGQQWDVWRVLFANGELIRITDELGEKRFPLWDPSGEWLFYNSFRDSQSQINMVSAKGGQSFPLHMNGPHDSLTDVSADGHQLLCYGERQESDIFSIGINDVAASERQITDYLGAEFWPSVSPDGQQLAFHLLPGERFQWDPRQSLLRVRSLDEQGNLLELAAQALEPKWSPDGKWIAFLRRTKPLFQLVLIRSMGGDTEQVLVDGNVFFAGYTTGPAFNTFKVSDFAWSLDSKQIAYCSKTGELMNLNVADQESRGTRTIYGSDNSKQEISSPLWSPNGQQLAWTVETPDALTGRWSRSLWFSVVGEPQPRQIWQTDENLRLLGWSTEDELIIATLKGDDSNTARRANVRLSRLSITWPVPQLIRELSAAYLSNLQLSSDRRNVSAVMAPDGRDNLWIVSLSGDRFWQVTANTDAKAFISSSAWSPDGQRIYYGKQTRWSLLSIISQK